MDRTSTTDEFSGTEGRDDLVFGPVDGPADRPSESPVAGPYYINAEELLAPLAFEAHDGAGAGTKSAGAQSDDTLETSAESAAGRGFLPVDRRDFMRLFSTSAMLASAACVRRPVEKAIPYVNQPVDFVPGVAVNYATTCQECSASCGIVVKTREGRPVKVEGNTQHPANLGGVCALGQSTLQALYHPERRKKPFIRHDKTLSESQWEGFYQSAAERLGKAKNIGIIAPPSSGHVAGFYKSFLKQMGSSENNLFMYDGQAHTAIVASAHKVAFGIEGLPRMEISRAERMVGIGSDFLDVGTQSVAHSKGFAQFHSVRGNKRGHFTQFESVLSMTGSKADQRVVIAPGSELGVVLALVAALVERNDSRGGAAERSRIQSIISSQKSRIESALAQHGIKEAIEKLAPELVRSKSLIVAGTSQAFTEESTLVQLAAIMANILIGAYGATLFLDEGWVPFAADASDVNKLVSGVGKLDAVIVIQSNPAFALPASSGFRDALAKVGTVISLQSMLSETDEYAHLVGNVNHYLESWGDEQPFAGIWSLRQPTVRPLGDSHQAEDVLLWIAAAMKKPMGFTDYSAFLRDKWKAVQAGSDNKGTFESFFHDAQRRGFVGRFTKQPVSGMSDVSSAFTSKASMASSEGGLKLLAVVDARLRDGRGANRPVLQEAGDALTTIAWDTWVGMNPTTAEKMGFKRNDMLLVEGPGGSFKAALYPLPGLHADAVVVPRGNGHEAIFGKVSEGVGANPLIAFARSVDPISGAAVTGGQTVKLGRTGEIFRLAAMQKSADVGNRHDIVRDVSVESAVHNQSQKRNLDDVPDMYPKLPGGNYRWAMSVDLDKCTGCGSCMVACAQENNVAQVGRRQVAMGREMHWIRMDRYFKGSLDNPQVTFQPMLCQQCNHAPCEAVCPVFATTHDPEGINAQTYNRCIGTRYCANACPYKVRRFNWFAYKWNIIGEREVDRNPRALNPDVTVRTRGVMEKCTFCVQRITVAKHKAKEKNTRVQDGDVVVACQQTCPSDAIIFGDLTDPNSRISQARSDFRAYLALGGDPDLKEYGLKTLPNVSYLKKIVLADASESSHHE